MLETSLTPIIRYAPFVVGAGALLLYWQQKKSLPVSIFKSSSPTPTLNTFSVDFTKQAQKEQIDPVIGREIEVMRLAQVLSRRNKNNAILVGPPGVGKTAIVEGLAARIVRGEIPDELKGKRVLALEVASLLSGTKYRGEFEERAKKIVREISAARRSIVLFIDEIHSVIQSQGTEGAINFSDILKPALARGDLQMIGATTIDEYEKYIKSDPSLERRFQVIDVRETTPEETFQILRGVISKYQEYHKVEFTEAALHAAIELTKKNIKNRKLPDKAIDAIDEAAAMVRVTHSDKVLQGVLHEAANKKTTANKYALDEIEETDKKIKKTRSRKKKAELTDRREEWESVLQKKGILTVDSDDILKVVTEWTEDAKRLESAERS